MAQWLTLVLSKNSSSIFCADPATTGTTGRFLSLLQFGLFAGPGIHLVDDRGVKVQVSFSNKALAQLVLKHTATDFLQFTVTKVAQLERTKGNADQAVHGKIKVLKNPLNFAVLAFTQANGQPNVVAFFSVQCRFNSAIKNTVNGNTVFQGIQLLLSHLAVGAHAVAAQPASCRQLNHAGKATIIGQQQQTFGVDVQAANSHNAWHVSRQDVKNSFTTLRVFIRGYRATWFVEQPEARPLTGWQRFAINDNLVFLGNGKSWCFQHGAVDADTASFNPCFCITARAQTSTCHCLGNTFACNGDCLIWFFVAGGFFGLLARFAGGARWFFTAVFHWLLPGEPGPLTFYTLIRYTG
ncbi:hypothetical protein PsWM33_00024 [Pseudovibrio sp. WM33]|nr:hypothetical protein PsWM33_00024 [Pseudovibrio sp. WM33]